MSECILLAVAEAYPWFFPLLMVVFGGIFGSFLSCMSYRLPRGLNPSQPPSYCPACGTTLGVVDLAPVLSWLWLRGKCRHCGTPFGVRYLAIELFTIVASYGVWLLVGPHWHLLPAFAATVGFIYVGLVLLQRQPAWRVLLFSLSLCLLIWLS